MSGPAKDTVATAIHKLRGTLPPSEARVARMLLDGYPVSGIGTIAELAERSKVSGPTVLRLVFRLGFATFADFERALLDEVVARLATAADYLDIEQGAADHDLGATVLREAADNIVADMRTLMPGELDNVVRVLVGARTVVTVGGWLTRSFADFFCLQLQLLRPRCRSLNSPYWSSGSDLFELGRRDVVVAFDTRPYTQVSPVEQVCTWARQRGARVILFTDVWLSPAAKQASHVLASRTSSSSPFDSFTSMLAVMEAVLASVAAELGESVRHRTAEGEALFDGWAWNPPNPASPS